MNPPKIRLTLTAALAALACAGAAHAAIIAQFTPISNAANYRWVQNSIGTGGSFSSIGSYSPTVGCTTCTDTRFSFLDPTASDLAFLPASFQINAAVASPTPANVNGSGVWTQTNLNGDFSFTYWDSSLVPGATTTIDGFTLVNGVTNLLSGDFTGAWIQGAGGSGSTNLTIPNGGSGTFTSAILSPLRLAPGSGEFALNLLTVSPHFFAQPGRSLRGFTANGGGNFSAMVIPEPAAWSLMILGFGGVGAMFRSRRRAAAAA